MSKRLPASARGPRVLFGKTYMWLLDSEGKLGLHKVSDRGDLTEAEAAALMLKQGLENE